MLIDSPLIRRLIQLISPITSGGVVAIRSLLALFGANVLFISCFGDFGCSSDTTRLKGGMLFNQLDWLAVCLLILGSGALAIAVLIISLVTVPCFIR